MGLHWALNTLPKSTSPKTRAEKREVFLGYTVLRQLQEFGVSICNSQCVRSYRASSGPWEMLTAGMHQKTLLLLQSSGAWLQYHAPHRMESPQTLPWWRMSPEWVWILAEPCHLLLWQKAFSSADGKRCISPRQMLKFKKYFSRQQSQVQDVFWPFHSWVFRNLLKCYGTPASWDVKACSICTVSFVIRVKGRKWLLHLPFHVCTKSYELKS